MEELHKEFSEVLALAHFLAWHTKDERYVEEFKRLENEAERIYKEAEDFVKLQNKLRKCVEDEMNMPGGE